MKFDLKTTLAAALTIAWFSAAAVAADTEPLVRADAAGGSPAIIAYATP